MAAVNPSDHPIIEQIREIAKACGWAVGVHGSLVRDIDLIAVPWVESAVEVTRLVAAIAEGIGYDHHHNGHGPGRRAHGRFTALLIAKDADNDQIRFNEGRTTAQPNPKGTWYPPAIDLSIVDPREPAP